MKAFPVPQPLFSLINVCFAVLLGLAIATQHLIIIILMISVCVSVIFILVGSLTMLSVQTILFLLGRCNHEER